VSSQNSQTIAANIQVGGAIADLKLLDQSRPRLRGISRLIAVGDDTDAALGNEFST